MLFLKPVAITVMMIPMLTLIGCGPSKPAPIKDATVTIEGKPNEKVYISIDAKVVRIEGRSTSVQGSGNYGVRTLDENGRLMISINEIVEPKPLHGCIVTLVNLNDDPVKLTVSADGEEKRVEEVKGKLQYADVQIGYQEKHEPDSPMAHDPENSVYEAKEYLKQKSAESVKPGDEPKQKSKGV